MKMRKRFKKIGITMRLDCIPERNEIREAIDVKFPEFIAAAKMIPIMLSSALDSFDSLKLDGVILTGGNTLYGINKKCKLSKKRDIFETKLLEYCIKKNIPLFGVCRGCQFIANYFGCIVAEIKKHVNVRHGLSVIDSINIEPPYDLFPYFFKPLFYMNTVNSFHNYGIIEIPKSVSQTIAVAAYCLEEKNFVIEAIYHTQLPIAGIMWHPEREKTFRKSDLEIFKRFFQKKRISYEIFYTCSRSRRTNGESYPKLSEMYGKMEKQRIDKLYY